MVNAAMPIVPACRRPEFIGYLNGDHFHYSLLDITIFDRLVSEASLEPVVGVLGGKCTMSLPTLKESTTLKDCECVKYTPYKA